MSSSRIRLYLDLKLSPLELSRWRKLPYGQFGRYRLNPAKYLKEMTSKWSIFEKPFLSPDSPRAMNFQLPVPDWPKIPDSPPGFFPSTRDYTSTFLFSRGECEFSDSSDSIRCGESASFSLTLDDMRLHSVGTIWKWQVTSSEPDDIQIISVTPHLFGKSATVEVEASDTFDGTATICARVNLAGGSLLQEIVYAVPLAWWDPKYEQRWQNLAYMLKTFIPISEIRERDESYDCGCVELKVLCCDDSEIAWDSDTSAETVAQNGSCTVAITDSLGSGGPYSWSVAGTGFSLSSAQTTGLSNTLNAGGSACGAATITVTGCGGAVVTGYVRCTTGHWGDLEVIGSNCTACPADSCSPGLISGESLLDYATICRANSPSECDLCCDVNCSSIGTASKASDDCNSPRYCFDTMQKWYKWIC